MNPVRIRLTKKKKTFNMTYRVGEVYQANVRRDGHAVLIHGPVFSPDEWELYISDREYDKILAG